jgi:hypothetical protein
MVDAVIDILGDEFKKKCLGILARWGLGILAGWVCNWVKKHRKTIRSKIVYFSKSLKNTLDHFLMNC